MKHRVLVVGAGMAGSEAAHFLARHGVSVVLVEGKRIRRNPAQKLEQFAELVCTNSLKSKNKDSAHGLLKEEMSHMGSLILEMANKSQVPAGDALAVDRQKFSELVTDSLEKNPLIEIIHEEVENPIALAEQHNCTQIIVASGPLTTEKLSHWIQSEISNDDYYFYDAIAPVVDGDSLDYSKLYFKDRHTPVSEEEGVEADYLNAPLNKIEYEQLVNEFINGEKVPAQNFEEYKFFEACLPIDLMAERGVDTPRFGPMKPIGLEREDGSRPYACVQLRRENLAGSAFNLVGFQTRLKYPEQVRILRLIPGFAEANFLHLGSVHRNSFLNARTLLNFDLSSIKINNLFFAGQMTGVEGYTESASIGLYVASQVLRKLKGKEAKKWPIETGIGALVNYIMTAPKPVPSNINFGLLPRVDVKGKIKGKRSEIKRMKKFLAAKRANETFQNLWGEYMKEL